MLLLLVLSTQSSAQTTTNASLSGIVQDTSKAVLPGAMVSAINNATGVKSSATANNAGVYNFPSLPAGIYKVTAEMPGFQTNTKTDVQLNLGTRANLNFELLVAGVATQIEITSSAQDMLLESTSTTGAILRSETALALPQVNNDMMRLIEVMGGVVKAEDEIFGKSSETFAGVMGANINIQRDGMTVNDVRFNSGIVSTSRISPDMVGEFKLVLSPVDAEMGRGAGQVQILTRSGGNAYHGSGVWNIMNTTLNANEWANNRTTPATNPPWRNVNEYTISAGGPIVKNKTFFYATWDHNIVVIKDVVRGSVLTPCARKGIYRYFGGWINGNTQATITRGSNSNTRPVVNADGTPLIPADNRDGTAYTGTGNIPSIQGLNAYSVLGQLTPAALAQIQADPINCSQYLPNGLSITGDNGIVPGTNWDPYRKTYDQSGFISRFTNVMPLPNDYFIGDGLNTADIKWTRTLIGQDTVYGNGMDNRRKAFTIKLDHNLNTNHRLSGTYSYESDIADASESMWPDISGSGRTGFNGSQIRKPQTFTASVTSTLRPTLLNEFRMGMSYNSSHNGMAFDDPRTGQQVQALYQQLMPTTDASWGAYQGRSLWIAPGGTTCSNCTGTPTAAATFQPPSSPIGGRNIVESTWGSADSRWTYADTVTWTKGSHSFKGGFELRLNKGRSDLNGGATFSAATSSLTIPTIFGGSTVNSPPSGITSWNGIVGINSGASSTGSYLGAYTLMGYTAGSLGMVEQYYFVNSPTAKTWSDPTTPDGQKRLVRGNQREFGAFYKDDWKVNSSLTLNLGVRWEYYGAPYMLNGMTIGMVGGPMAAFSGSGVDLTTWMPQNPTFDSSKLTTLQFIGPGSPNSGQSLIDRDLNNFAPAVGFAWQLPWFGKGKTTLRGGYQASFLTQTGQMDPNSWLFGAAGSSPGTVYNHNWMGDNTTYQYLDLANLKNYVPTSRFWDGSIQPLAIRPVTDRSQTLIAYDQNIKSPYIQSLTMALTRNIGSSLTVDVRYIGTLSRKMITSVNLNTPNFLNNGLKDAFDAARRGGQSALLDTLIRPSTLVANTTSGADQLRAYSPWRTNLAIGNYSALASSLAVSNGCVSTQSGCQMPAVPAGVRGQLLRNSGTAENFIYTNPQFSTVNWFSNLTHSNYHSMQLQVTMRPAHGLSLQASYTWSRNLGDLPSGTTDVLNRAADYGLLSSNRSHQLSTYGTYELPLGSKGLLFRNSSSTVKKIAEGWQLSWVGTKTSGLPMALTNTGNSLWGGTSIDLVRPDLFDSKSGSVTWEPGAAYGLYWAADPGTVPAGATYKSRYMQVADPQCSNSSMVVASLQATCAANAHALAVVDHYDSNNQPVAGAIVFQRAIPGVRGNYKPYGVTGFGRWSLDLAMSKSIEFMEGKSFNIRFDAQNIFNHPSPSGTYPYFTNNYRDTTVYNPTSGLDTTTTPLGYLQYKGGHRTFAAKLRVSF